jgi:hypothetical protein
LAINRVDKIFLWRPDPRPKPTKKAGPNDKKPKGKGAPGLAVSNVFYWFYGSGGFDGFFWFYGSGGFDGFFWFFWI